VDGKRIRYRYPTADHDHTLTYVGFQEPVPEIPAGTLLRVSLAHPWRPKDQPQEELRCFVQLSGWFLPDPVPGMDAPEPTRVAPQPEAEPVADPGAPISFGSAEAEADLLARAKQVLKGTFGFGGFLPVQEEVVRRVLAGQDTLVVMPTGGGKSLHPWSH